MGIVLEDRYGNEVEVEFSLWEMMEEGQEAVMVAIAA